MNRNEYDVRRAADDGAQRRRMRYFDLYHGVELKPVTKEGNDVLSLHDGGAWLWRGTGHMRASRMPDSKS